MLFTSLEFILIFLPCTLLAFFWATQAKAHSARYCLVVLSLTSLIFYSYWSIPYLGLLVFSLSFNYGIGLAIRKYDSWKKGFLYFGILFDLGLLAYFKYVNFFIENFNLLSGSQHSLLSITLPLGISFFTFQQIAYRMEVYRGNRKQDDFLTYVSCVTFFPHLIAGPIVYYAELIPQFKKKSFPKLPSRNLSLGLLVFLIGLWKKNCADWFLMPHANFYFELLAQKNVELTLVEGWFGTLAYTLQLYFDFSGYCDMAIGLGLLFNIRLPLNFNSPYQSLSLREFWQRWHMTLSRFIRTYVYEPLMEIIPSRALCILLAMTLSGFWHGAGWTFVAWGFFHGVCLCLNHILGNLSPWVSFKLSRPKLSTFLSGMITLMAVMTGWVFFRASSMGEALQMLKAMYGGNGLALPRSLALAFPALDSWNIPGVTFSSMFSHGGVANGFIVFVFFGVAVLLPNLYEWLGEFETVIEGDYRHGKLQRMEPVVRSLGALSGAFAGGLLFLHILNYFTVARRAFLYFNF